MGAPLITPLFCTLANLRDLLEVVENQCAALGALKQTKSVSRDLKRFVAIRGTLRFHIAEHPSNQKRRSHRGNRRPRT